MGLPLRKDSIAIEKEEESIEKKLLDIRKKAEKLLEELNEFEAGIGALDVGSKEFDKRIKRVEELMKDNFPAEMIMCFKQELIQLQGMKNGDQFLKRRGALRSLIEREKEIVIVIINEVTLGRKNLHVYIKKLLGYLKK